MRGERLTYRLTMCSAKIYTLKFVAISIFMNFFFKIIAFSLESVPLYKTIITPPKQMQTLLLYWL
jgi:hypothetical protein